MIGTAEVSVAIPVRDGGEQFAGVLRALAAQTVAHELIVYDSGSRDGSAARAEEHGARVLEIPSEQFNHGRVRNMLVHAARGVHVALLTQDAEPADGQWLERLLSGFELADDVAIVYGRYLPRAGASAAVRLELERWFESLSRDGEPRVDRLASHERANLNAATGSAAAGANADPAGAGLLAELLGRRGFFTDANACVARSAWERVPFREVPYAEDRVLALDMLRAGYAKAFVPGAAVVHSHAYTPIDQLRRSFDEWRGLLEVYGWREPLSAEHLSGQLRGVLGHARRELVRDGVSPLRRQATLATVAGHQLVTLVGALLGSRADRVPPVVRRRLSLEGRGGFSPVAR